MKKTMISISAFVLTLCLLLGALPLTVPALTYGLQTKKAPTASFSFVIKK